MRVPIAEQIQLVCGSAELVQWSVHRAGDEVTVALTGEVDISNEAALSRALAEVVGMKPERIVIDLAGVSYLDSSGVRCLLNVSKHAAAAGAQAFIRKPLDPLALVSAVRDLIGTSAIVRTARRAPQG